MVLVSDRLLLAAKQQWLGLRWGSGIVCCRDEAFRLIQGEGRDSNILYKQENEHEDPVGFWLAKGRYEACPVYFRVLDRLAQPPTESNGTVPSTDGIPATAHQGQAYAECGNPKEASTCRSSLTKGNLSKHPTVTTPLRPFAPYLWTGHGDAYDSQSMASTKAAPLKRTRISDAKSRTGCITCK